MSLRHRVHEILNVAKPEDRTSRLVDLGILSLIAVNVLVIVVESTEDVRSMADLPVFYWRFEVFSVVIFSAEYALRIWSCIEDPRYRRPIVGRLRYMLKPMAVVDLLAIAPFYLTVFGLVSGDLRMMRVLRLFRMFRVLKLGRYSTAMQTVTRALRSRRHELLFSVFVIFVLLLIASTLMYYAEQDGQPDKFGSIPASMWWGIATLTTVGYGDFVPTTGIGRVVGAFIAVLGIGVFALPAGILAGALTEAMGELKAGGSRGGRCPHCGEALDVEPVDSQD